MTHRLAVFAIVDTNVVVSGLLTSEATSPTCQILDGMLERLFNFLLSVDLLGEYRSGLLRPKIRQLHGLTNEEVDRLLTEIAANATVYEPGKASAKPPDAADQQLWDLLESNVNSVLITGDRKLLESAHHSKRIMNPRTFVDSLL